jgi:hypothetical protein
MVPAFAWRIKNRIMGIGAAGIRGLAVLLDGRF